MICAIALFAGLTAAEADDWNQWGGPNRNFHASSTGLNVSWGPDGPERLWSRVLGEGYSSIVASSDRLFTMYRDDETEVVVSLDAATGKTRWEHRYNASLKEDMNYGTWLRQGGAGPYSTPLLRSGVLYAVGVTGKFHAFDASSGEILWAHDLDDMFDMSGYSGFAPSPLAYGGNVILPVGGRGQAVVAFDLESGAVAWKNQDFRLAPASPLLIDVDGEE